MKRKSDINSLVIALIILTLVFFVALVLLICAKEKGGLTNPDFGGLIGGSLGGIGTLLAVIFSLKETRKQIIEDRHTSIKPMLNIWHRNGADSQRDLLHECDIYDLVYMPNTPLIEQKVRFTPNALYFERQLIIHNIGLGAAVDVEISITKDNSISRTINKFSLENGQKTIRNLKMIITEDILSYVGLYCMKFTFFDLMGREYYQTLEMRLVNDATVHCGLNLDNFLHATLSCPTDLVR